MSTHTPGDWDASEYDKKNETPSVILIKNKQPRVFFYIDLESKDGKSIAQVQMDSCSSGIDFDEFMKNFALIKAAPNMLSMLEEISIQVRESNEILPGTAMDLTRTIALAKEDIPWLQAHQQEGV